MYKRLLCSVAILGASLSLSGQTSPAAPDPNIDPSAMAALDHMGAYMRTLKTFEVKAAQTTDDVLDNGQVVQSSVAVDILAQRPNRMK